ncbi:cytochrome c oxidase assembly protein COX18, mitochondrial-like [Gigantopelta aegis]|uniref:cytochrome c oxidase assembly protein COX18, mitochondrial-like n=1 Tax=Gigantopelta aegis TaxID=1735272 RepID=UPI001B88BC47|nr:cytochrome c oxidase assembly protein COX18, mitochondrial-like [Gigantopelta aegis]XP_041362242.1 cytochrome c oxidase assembly protein COX18, mitochondrial-like [Gigantopelta aegis]
MQGVGSRTEKPLKAVCDIFNSRFCIKQKQHLFDQAAVRNGETLRTTYCLDHYHDGHIRSHKPISKTPGCTTGSCVGYYHDTHIRSHNPIFQSSGQPVGSYLGYYHDDHIRSQNPLYQSSRRPIGSYFGCYHNVHIRSHEPISQASGQIIRSLSCNRSHTSNCSSLFRHQTGLLSSCFDHNTNYSLQKRHFSAETYYKYFSPDFPPIGFAQSVLEHIHDFTGLPWWASILFTTFMLRTVITLPLAVHAMKVIAKVEMLQPEIKDLSKELKKEVAMAVKKFGWEQPRARKTYNATMKKLIRDLYVRDNCHPMKASVLALIQLPMWFCLSFGLRNMSGAVPVPGLVLPVLCPGLLTEGTLWFTNLTVPDALWIIPISMGVFNLINIELHALERTKTNRLQKIITNVMRVISLLMIGVGGLVPSSMSLYWSCSSLFGVAQTLAFKSPRVKRSLGIPKTPRESDTPFRDLWETTKNKYTWNKSGGK